MTWVASRLFDIKITVYPLGSGDTTYNYIEIFCYAVTAAAGAAIWSIFDWNRRDYCKLHQWINVLLRYVLFVTMLSYGFSKVFRGQFSDPTTDQLMRTYGESSPMGLLWTFMAASAPYTIFSGVAEVVGGILLIPRRTATLGALVCAGVMLNVVLLNFCYDTPVKLYSSHLMFMAIFIALSEFRNLTNIFILGRPAAPRFEPLFNDRAANVGAIFIKWAFFIYMLWPQAEALAALANKRETEQAASRPAIAGGAFDVEEFIVDGAPLPPLTTDKFRWRRIAVNRYGFITIRRMDDARDRYRFAVNESAGTAALSPFQGMAGSTGSFTYQFTDADHLELAGTLDGKSIVVRLKRFPDNQFFLMSRGFHWINEVPLNR